VPVVHPPPPPELPPFDDIAGERGGKGDSINNVAGDRPMKAPEDEQVQGYADDIRVSIPGRVAPNAPLGTAGNGGNGGRPAAAKEASIPHPRRGGAAAMIAMLPQPPHQTVPLGLPPTATPPPVLAPRPLRLVRPDLIGIPVPGQPDAPTTQLADKNPPTTSSAITQADSPTTAPVAQAPVTRPSAEGVTSTPPSTAPTVANAATHPAQQVAMNIPPVRTPPTSAPVGLPPSSTLPIVNAPLKEPTTLPVARVAVASADVAPPSPDSPSAPVAVSGAPGQPGGMARGGNASDTESDPTGKDVTISFVNGRVVAREGRKVKTARPQLTDAGYLALMAMERPQVVLTAKIDQTGKVVHVEVYQSSGSDEVDLPAYQCLWKWEFEPTRDKEGNPIPDELVVRLVWH
jgi:TonB family protein